MHETLLQLKMSTCLQCGPSLQWCTQPIKFSKDNGCVNGRLPDHGPPHVDCGPTRVLHNNFHHGIANLLTILSPESQIFIPPTKGSAGAGASTHRLPSCLNIHLLYACNSAVRCMQAASQDLWPEVRTPELQISYRKYTSERRRTLHSRVLCWPFASLCSAS
jgi:hypothetical protein